MHNQKVTPLFLTSYTPFLVPTLRYALKPEELDDC